MRSADLSVGERLCSYFLCVSFLAGNFLVVDGSVRIKKCSEHGWLELQENDVATPKITCEGLDANHTAFWQLLKDGTDQGRSLCGTFGNVCNSTSQDIQAYRLTDSTSSLYIVSKLRKVANGSVLCSAAGGDGSGTSLSSSCRINVVAPAILTECKVTMTFDRTLAGTCRFLEAYSSNDTYTCTWTQNWTDGQRSESTTIAGKIDKVSTQTSGNTYYSGTCSFKSSRLPEGRYSYTVHFFPGPSTVEEGSGHVIGPAIVPSGNRSTVAMPSTTNNTPSSEKSLSLTVYIIIGVTAGVVVVTIIIGAVLIRRFKAKTPETPKVKPRSRRQTPANHFVPFHENKAMWDNDRMHAHRLSNSAPASDNDRMHAHRLSNSAPASDNDRMHAHRLSSAV